MSPYPTYHLFQAERPRSAAEVREADARLGQSAAAAHRFVRLLGRPVVALRGLDPRQPAIGPASTGARGEGPDGAQLDGHRQGTWPPTTATGAATVDRDLEPASTR